MGKETRDVDTGNARLLFCKQLTLYSPRSQRERNTCHAFMQPRTELAPQKGLERSPAKIFAGSPNGAFLVLGVNLFLNSTSFRR